LRVELRVESEEWRVESGVGRQKNNTGIYKLT